MTIRRWTGVNASFTVQSLFITDFEPPAWMSMHIEIMSVRAQTLNPAASQSSVAPCLNTRRLWSAGGLRPACRDCLFVGPLGHLPLSGTGSGAGPVWLSGMGDSGRLLFDWWWSISCHFGLEYRILWYRRLTGHFNSPGRGGGLQDPE